METMLEALKVVFSPPLSTAAVHLDLHGDPVQAHLLWELLVPAVVSGHWIPHGYVLSHLHTRLCALQDCQV